MAGMTTQNRQQSNAKKAHQTKHKSIVLRDCQMQILNIYMRRKGVLLIFFRHFVELLLPKINRYWATFETLAEIERDCKERNLNSAWGIIFVLSEMKPRSVMVDLYRVTQCGIHV